MFLDKIIRVFFTVEKWNVGILSIPISDLLSNGSVTEAVWMKEMPGTGFTADPFGLAQDSKVYIYFEQVDRESTKGSISKVEFINGTFSSPKSVMRMPAHMSYPYVFRENDQIYCIPETCELEEVALYKAVDFPLKWNKEAVLLSDFAGVDNTIVKHNGIWWMMCTVKANKGADRDLHLYYSDKLKSGWKPHSKNPVKIDIASARPGGTPFVHNGKLYRPSQDSSRTYGGRIAINEVITLTPDEFEERTVTHIEPDKNGPYPDGIHTLSSVGDHTLIDGKRFEYSIVKPFKVMMRLLLGSKKQNEQ